MTIISIIDSSQSFPSDVDLLPRLVAVTRLNEEGFEGGEYFIAVFVKLSAAVTSKKSLKNDPHSSPSRIAKVLIPAHAGY